MDELILIMGFDTFQSWLVHGVVFFTFGTGTRLADYLNDAQAEDKNEFLISLPPKYSRFVCQQQQVYLLVDEIKAVSLVSEEKTKEWASRLHNLGETWLPFQYRPDWLNMVVFPAHPISERVQAQTPATSCEVSVAKEDSKPAQETIEPKKQPSKRSSSKKMKAQEQEQSARTSRNKKTNKRVEPVQEGQLPLIIVGDTKMLPKQEEGQEVADE